MQTRKRLERQCRGWGQGTKKEPRPMRPGPPPTSLFSSSPADAHERTPTSDSWRRCRCWWARAAIPASASARPGMASSPDAVEHHGRVVGTIRVFETGDIRRHRRFNGFRSAPVSSGPVRRPTRPHPAVARVRPLSRGRSGPQRTSTLTARQVTAVRPLDRSSPPHSLAVRRTPPTRSHARSTRPRHAQPVRRRFRR